MDLKTAKLGDDVKLGQTDEFVVGDKLVTLTVVIHQKEESLAELQALAVSTQGKLAKFDKPEKIEK